MALAWYKPNQWRRLREISEDRDQLEETFGEWQVNAEKAMKDYLDNGTALMKVTVDIEELLHWCNEHDLKVNGASRSRYVSWLLKEKEK